MIAMQAYVILHHQADDLIVNTLFMYTMEVITMTTEEIMNLNFFEKIDLATEGADEVLDALVNDSNWRVRVAILQHDRAKDLNVLVADGCADVRCAVAKRGRDKDLDILVHDSSWYVREAVADYGRDKDLAILINDPDVRVRATALSKRNLNQ